MGGIIAAQKLRNFEAAIAWISFTEEAIEIVTCLYITSKLLGAGGGPMVCYVQ